MLKAYLINKFYPSPNVAVQSQKLSLLKVSKYYSQIDYFCTFAKLPEPGGKLWILPAVSRTHCHCHLQKRDATLATPHFRTKRSNKQNNSHKLHKTNVTQWQLLPLLALTWAPRTRASV